MDFSLSSGATFWGVANDIALVLGLAAIVVTFIFVVANDRLRGKDQPAWTAPLVVGGVTVLLLFLVSSNLWFSATNAEYEEQLEAQVSELYGIDLPDGAASRLLDGTQGPHLRDGRDEGFVDRFGIAEFTDESGATVAVQLTWDGTEWVLTGVDEADELTRV